MKTFEERYTAWVDGLLTGTELEQFEREIEDRESAEKDRKDAQKLRKLLRTAGAPALRNADFFNHQLLARIESDRKVTSVSPSRPFFSLPWVRVASAGFAALAIGWVLGSTMKTGSRDTLADANLAEHHLASIISAQSADPGISASIVRDDQGDVTVLWLDGLDYLPASYELQ